MAKFTFNYEVRISVEAESLADADDVMENFMVGSPDNLSVDGYDIDSIYSHKRNEHLIVPTVDSDELKEWMDKG